MLKPLWRKVNATATHIICPSFLSCPYNLNWSELWAHWPEMEESKVRGTLLMIKHEITSDFIRLPLSITDCSCNSAHNSNQSHALPANISWTDEWVNLIQRTFFTEWWRILTVISILNPAVFYIYFFFFFLWTFITLYLVLYYLCIKKG